MENVEQLVGPLLDLSEVDDHVVGVDRYVQTQHVLESPLRAADSLERVEDQSLELVEDFGHIGQLDFRLGQILLDLGLLRLRQNVKPPTSGARQWCIAYVCMYA